uniref:Protein tyrosine phosphatase receptor type Eb n=1 Tax=Sinocyclocheilus rhinocerous TaxID=307959 RepID=A0A673IGL4_9TELE
FFRESAYKRFREQRKDLVASVDKKLPNGFLEDQEQTVVLLPRSPSPSKRYFPIPLDALEEEFRLRMADDGKLFREEFNSLPCGFGCGTFEEASREENREKNRYPNILPCMCSSHLQTFQTLWKSLFCVI